MIVRMSNGLMFPVSIESAIPRYGFEPPLMRILFYSHQKSEGACAAYCVPHLSFH